VPFHLYRFAAILGAIFAILAPAGGTELRSETLDEQVANYYPQSLLDVMTKEQLDDLVREILADPQMVDKFIKSIGGGAERYEIWNRALSAFVKNPTLVPGCIQNVAPDTGRSRRLSDAKGSEQKQAYCRAVRTAL